MRRFTHDLPVVFIGANNRGTITGSDHFQSELIGGKKSRRSAYIKALGTAINGNNLANLKLQNSVEHWFVSAALSSNSYQKDEDNRNVEIKTVLQSLNKIDSRIDPNFLEISGGGKVSIEVDQVKCELSHLSSGYASILKIIQSIVSGYSAYKNETNIMNVRGYVLIDEIESHLHLLWQSKIVPLLKNIFPNTIFYIATHSPIVLTLHQEGEAYKLQRDNLGTVHAHPIRSPNKSMVSEILDVAFDIDTNREKLDAITADQQKSTKKDLMNLINKSTG